MNLENEYNFKLETVLPLLTYSTVAFIHRTPLLLGVGIAQSV
jgi:hypothetical protein